MALGKHSIYTHFPKDRNCEVCLRTKMTLAPCRRRIGEAVPRVEKFGDLITADHKVLNKECESRDNHRYSRGTRSCHSMDSILSVQNKNFSGDGKRVYESVSSRQKSRKSFYTDNSLEISKSCEDLSWNHRTSTPHRSETHGIAERAIRRAKEATSAVLLQSGFDEKWWADSMECCCYLGKMCKTSWQMGKLLMKGDSENHSKAQ